MDKHDSVTYYVDESGDLTLFDKKGRPVQDKGSSKTLMLGLIKLKEGNDFSQHFESFKKTIITDPTFQTFPSIEKTKLKFHAKDDHVTIKREVYKYIANLDFSVQVIVRRKSVLIEQAITQFEYDKQKMKDKQIYSDLVRRLFDKNIHKANYYNIYFANRGKTFTNHSLKEAMFNTREKFCNKYGIAVNSHFKVFCVESSNYYGLQIIDYCLWALQRMYEKGEDAYFKIIQDKFKLIIDVDDKRRKGYGVYYTTKNKISLQSINGVS